MPTIAALALAACAAGQETVRLKDAGSYRGELVRWDDDGVALKWGPRGETKEWPLAQVAGVDAARGPELEAAEAALQAGKFGEAEALFRAALGGEQRGWARDRMLAELLRCLRAQRKHLAQAETFLKLAPRRTDAAVVALAPLRWLPGEALGDNARTAARAWLGAANGQGLPRLLAANWLLDTDDAAAGERELEKLLTDPDARVRPLAKALLLRRRWEATGLPPPHGDLADFRSDLEKLPPPLRGGPQYVLARMQETAVPPAAAALLYLPVALVHSAPEDIQADALRRAAVLARAAGMPADAAKLDAERQKRFPKG